jgi:hypothetical protein
LIVSTAVSSPRVGRRDRRGPGVRDFDETVNVADADPAGIGRLAGTVAASLFELASVTTAPEPAAFRSGATVPVEAPPEQPSPG